MSAHERAEHLCKEAERLGLDGPTEGMVSDAFADLEFNHQQETKRLTAERDAALAELEKLKAIINDPAAVRVNILKGTIKAPDDQKQLSPRTSTQTNNP